MTLKLHNTPDHKVEEFVPIAPGKVTLYTCGPTVYDRPHVGNWTSFIYWDILVRTLIANGYSVERVMNITDVGHLVSDADEGEDKLEKGAKREGKTAWQIAEMYTKDFFAGIEKLGLIMPEHVVRATDYIPQQLDLVRTLKQKGYTYQIDDGIYFDTSKFPTYADFAGLDLDAQKAGARVAFNAKKRNPSDFALWKFTPAGEKRDMEWETPIDLLDQSAGPAGRSTPTSPASLDSVGVAPSPGTRASANAEKSAKNIPRMGFPGWHLECSAIAMNILGDTIDIHTGGIDHIPVHHTNEIAQSESATGKQFVHYWLHNNHLKVNGTKISKSLGNGYTLQDLKAKGFEPLDFRMFILQSQYSNEGNFTFGNLDAAKNRRQHWRNIAALRHQTHDALQQDLSNRTLPSLATIGAMQQALDDNLNTPEALRVIDEAFSDLETHSLDRINQQSLTELLETIDELLGLQLIPTTPDIDEKTKQHIVERERARDNKDWATSDAIRDELKSQNIILRDTSDGTIWEYDN